MGFYIQGPTKNKAAFIIVNYGGKIIAPPEKFSDIPKDVGLICVVDNGAFEAAAFVYDEKEFEAFGSSSDSDFRPRTWMTMKREDAIKLTGYDRD